MVSNVSLISSHSFLLQPGAKTRQINGEPDSVRSSDFCWNLVLTFFPDGSPINLNLKKNRKKNKKSLNSNVN